MELQGAWRKRERERLESGLARPWWWRVAAVGGAGGAVRGGGSSGGGGGRDGLGP